MPYKDKETQKVAKRESARRMRSRDNEGAPSLPSTPSLAVPKISAKSGTYNIPDINMNSVKLTLVGLGILVTNKISEQTLDEIEGDQTGRAKESGKPGKKARKPKIIEEVFAGHLHVMPGSQPVIIHDREYPMRAEGQFGFPGSGIFKSVIRVATMCGMTMVDAKMVFQVQDELCEIKTSHPVLCRRDFVRPKPGTMDLAYRPVFRDWTMDVTVIYNANALSVAQLLNLFRNAGIAVGIGCNRPERAGTWGRFRIKEDAIMVTEGIKI